MSLVEAVANGIVGMRIAVAPADPRVAGVGKNLRFAMPFAGGQIVRACALRPIFESLR